MVQTRALNPKEPYDSLCWGTLEGTVQIGGHARRFLTYIPDGARASTAGVFILGGNGSTVEELLTASGWRELADEEKIILFFLEPEAGIWQTEESYGDLNGDMAYINAVMVQSMARLHYCIHEAKYYLYGEDEGGTMAHMAAMNPPSDQTATAIIWSGVTTIRAGEVPQSYRDACRDDCCINVMGFWDAEGQLNRRKGSIPMPVWMIEGAAACSETLQYWQEANRATKSRQLVEGITEYFRTEDTENPCNQDKDAYRIWHAAEDIFQNMSAAERVRCIWSKFLSKHRRWMGDPGGELRMHMDPVQDLGMEYHREVIGGWQREWYVYIPKSVRNDPQTAVPLVFALHGYSCSGEIYIGNSGWHQVAEKYGFMVVYPTALPGKLTFKSVATSPDNMPMPAWNFQHNLPNGPDEFVFFNTLLERVNASHSVDQSRVYVTGHSHGSMMTQALALSMPEMFAAAAPCSGVFLAPMYEDFIKLPEIHANPKPIPVWMFAGKKEDWLIDAVPTPENATGNTIAFWHRRNNLSGQAEDQFETGWEIYKERWQDLIYRDGEGRPMLRYTAVDQFPHATNPEMSFRIWEEFFSHWSRENNTLRYCK